MNTTQKKKRGTVRRVTETALDVAIGGPVVAAETARDAVGKARKAVEQAVDEGRDAARTARRELRQNDARPYEERTRDELYEIAAERDIAGRSAMRKDELIEALRAER